MTTTPPDPDEVDPARSTSPELDDVPVLGADEPPPPNGLLQLREEPVNREHTRRHIAFILVGALVGLALVGSIGWLVWGDDTPRMQNFAIVFAPITTLFGTVIGFYFSSGDKPK